MTVTWMECMHSCLRTTGRLPKVGNCHEISLLLPDYSIQTWLPNPSLYFPVGLSGLPSALITPAIPLATLAYSTVHDFLLRFLAPTDSIIIEEGVNARLPNQDLLNSVQVISQWTGGSPTLVYDHKDLPDPHTLFPSWLQHFVSRGDVRRYKERARNVIKHMGYQTFGRPSGVHGVFHQYAFWPSAIWGSQIDDTVRFYRYRIDAITLYAVPATGPHGFYSFGK